MFSISGVVMLASLVYLTRDADQLGNFRNYYLELQPIFSWICFLSGQAIFFLATNLFFNLNSSGGNMVQARKEFRNVWIIFLAAIIVKFFVSNPAIRTVPSIGTEWNISFQRIL